MWCVMSALWLLAPTAPGQDLPKGVEDQLARCRTLLKESAARPQAIIPLTDAFELRAMPSGESTPGCLIASRSGVAGQIVTVFWATGDCPSGEYDIVAWVPDGERFVLVERVLLP